MNVNLDELLSKHKLRGTEIRRQVLQLFLRTPYALAYTDIAESIEGDLDKVTVYRTLKALEESGLIHEIKGDGNFSRYAICKSSCNHGAHRDAHVHFKRSSCGHCFCLAETKIPQLNLPEGYTASSLQLMITGVCKDCN